MVIMHFTMSSKAALNNAIIALVLAYGVIHSINGNMLEITSFDPSEKGVIIETLTNDGGVEFIDAVTFEELM